MYRRVIVPIYLATVANEIIIFEMYDTNKIK